MRRTAYGTLLLGLALFTGLIVWQGVAQVGGILAEGGWGLAVVPLSYLLSMAASAIAWGLCSRLKHRRYEGCFACAGSARASTICYPSRVSAVSWSGRG